jgi:hypothetical protein
MSKPKRRCTKARINYSCKDALDDEDDVEDESEYEIVSFY